ncbi:hypothetical protein LguiA_031876 [Lonicera macranthoides]
MASDLETKAKEAFIDDHFELALDLYSQAIAINPNHAELFADRAQANIKLNNFTDAVSDASKAIELDPSMPKAYLRKGMACIKLEEYQTAKAALEVGASLAVGDLRFTNLIKECDQGIAGNVVDCKPTPLELTTSRHRLWRLTISQNHLYVTQPDEEVRTLTGEFVTTYISHIEEVGELPKQLLDEAPTNVVTPGSESLDKSAVTPKDVEPNTTVPDSKPKYRHEFYQKPEEVVVTIFARDIPAQSVVVDYGEQILSVTIDVPGKDAYTFQPRLFGKIVPAKCKYEILSTKIEIRLAKAEPIQWTSLEYSKDNSVPRQICVSSVNQKPVYPSSKPKTVDWDKLEAEVKKEEKEEKLDGDAALNKFFRDIYQDADEDTRRAMRKSFIESNGTVLSTNWKEVGSKVVEGSAPDGMEMKKWEY